MTLDPKALDAAYRAYNSWGVTATAALPDAITAYLDALASRSSAIVEEPMAVAWAGPDELAYLARNPMSNATMWGAQRGKESSIPLYASPQPHTGRAGVTDEMVNAAWRSLQLEGHVLSDRLLRAALNAALTVEPVAPTKDEIRNEIARREEAGVDARVPLTGPAKFKGWSDADLRSAIAP